MAGLSDGGRSLHDGPVHNSGRRHFSQEGSHEGRGMQLTHSILTGQKFVPGF